MQANLDLNKYEVRFWADGDCMDAPEAPIRIKNGQRVKANAFADDFNIYRDYDIIKHKVCIIQYVVQGERYFAVKQVVGFDELTGNLRLAFYNPQKTFVYLKVEAIEKVYLVDSVEE